MVTTSFPHGSYKNMKVALREQTKNAADLAML